MTIEFDPQPLIQISVGDVVWMDLNPAVEKIRGEE